MPWMVLLCEEVEGWFVELAKADPESSNLVMAAVDMLEEEGPTLGRPLVETGFHRH